MVELKLERFMKYKKATLQQISVPYSKDTPSLKSLREFKDALERREFLEKKLAVNLDKLSHLSFEEGVVFNRNVENLVGAIDVPLGVAGPLKIEGFKEDVYLPLATTEGALVASISRGCKAISESGGAQTAVEDLGITRGPVFRVGDLKHSIEVKKWINKNQKELAKVTNATSSYLKLLKIRLLSEGRNVFTRFYFDTSDAMGMNMATIACEKAAELIEKETGAICISLAGNCDIDKKGAWLNFITGRGKRVWAEVVLKKEVIKEVLKTSPEKLVELVYRKCLIGSAMSGSLGFNAHFSNVIAALFIATGQDLAHVVEGSMGITSAELLENGDVYFSVYLPSVLVGTVGGGTSLPGQKQALELIGVYGAGKALKFAEIVGAAVLAGEISLLSSQAEGTLARSHIKLARKGQ